jgi:hypothetical protein
MMLIFVSSNCTVYPALQRSAMDIKLQSRSSSLNICAHIGLMFTLNCKYPVPTDNMSVYLSVSSVVYLAGTLAMNVVFRELYSHLVIIYSRLINV